jgi:hypothetical protein
MNVEPSAAARLPGSDSDLLFCIGELTRQFASSCIGNLLCHLRHSARATRALVQVLQLQGCPSVHGFIKRGLSKGAK